MNTNKISIIIPVYNAELYLSKCLDSIIQQQDINIEVLLINDGSKDNSLKICKEYELKYNFIKVFSQENRGQASARNKGIENATGDYICFVDADDYLPTSDILLTLINESENKNVDLICGIIEIKSQKGTTLINKPCIYNDYRYDIYCQQISFSPCGKLFATRVFKENKFPEGIINEDVAILPIIYRKCNCIKYVDKITYTYLLHETSTTQGQFNTKRFDMIAAVKNVMDDLQNQDSLSKYLILYNLFGYQLLSLYCNILTSVNDKDLRKKYKIRFFDEILSLKFTKKKVFYYSIYPYLHYNYSLFKRIKKLMLCFAFLFDLIKS